MTIGKDHRVPDTHFDGEARLDRNFPDNLAQVLNRMRDFSLGTTEAIDLYVATTGNDLASGASASAPLATIDAALAKIPEVVRHKCHIRVAAGNYTSFPEAVNKRFEADGQLTIEGTGDPVASAGPFTLTTYARSSNYTHSTWVVTGAGWTVDEFYGKWIRMTSGAAAGRSMPIFKNTADTITTPPMWTSSTGLPASPDTFEIVDPPVAIAVDHQVHFEHLNDLKGCPTQSASTIFAASRMGIAALKFNFTQTHQEYPFSMVGGNFEIQFSTFAVANGTSAANAVQALYAARATINSWTLADPAGFDNALFDGNIFNFQLQFGATPPFDTFGAATYYGSKQSSAKVTGLCSRAMHLVDGTDNYFNEFTVARFHLMSEAKCNSSYFYCDNVGLGASSGYGAVNIAQLAAIYLQYGHLEDTPGADAIVMSAMARLIIWNVSGNAANISGYAVSVGTMNQIAFYSASTLAGTTNDIWWTSNATASAWPTVDTLVTDSLGANCASSS